jgi:hypothetical protein
MSDQEEIWKDVEGYEGKYQVSNLGRVKSLYIRFKETGGKIIKPRISKDGYPVINLFHKGIEKHKGYSSRITASSKLIADCRMNISFSRLYYSFGKFLFSFSSTKFSFGSTKFSYSNLHILFIMH